MSFDQLVLLFTLIFMVITLSLGCAIYYVDTKEKVSFLRNFPFELRSKKNYNLNILFKSVLSLEVILLIFSSYVMFFVNNDIFTSRFLAIILIINAVVLLTLFLFDTTNYKIHVGIASTFMVTNIASFFILGYLSLRDNFAIYPLFVCIASFIVMAILIIVDFAPSLTTWWKMKKSSDSKGNTTYNRGKVFPLALAEWINVFASFLFFLIIFIYTLL
jgi:hypothetical protein